MLKKYWLILSYGAVLAVAAFALEFIDYRHSVRELSTELFIFLIALAFTVLGIWVGHRLTSPAVSADKATTAADDSSGIIKANEEKGVSGDELAAIKTEMESMKQQYANPLFRIPMTFVEIFPVGLIVSLFSAFLLSRRKPE